MPDPSFSYWHDPDVGLYIRRQVGIGTDILTNAGQWRKVDPKDHAGSIDPWAEKIGNGDLVSVDLADVPVKKR